MKTKMTVVFGLCAILNATAAPILNEPEYRYSAVWLATNSEGESRTATISFLGSKIYDSEADYVVGYSGCSAQDGYLSISSELPWLDFTIGLNDDIGSRHHRDSRTNEIVFESRSYILGIEVRVLAIRRTEKKVTVLFVNDDLGILGFGFFDSDPINYVQPVYWLEGKKGLCHK